LYGSALPWHADLHRSGTYGQSFFPFCKYTPPRAFERLSCACSTECIGWSPASERGNSSKKRTLKLSFLSCTLEAIITSFSNESLRRRVPVIVSNFEIWLISNGFSRKTMESLG